MSKSIFKYIDILCSCGCGEINHIRRADYLSGRNKGTIKGHSVNKGVESPRYNGGISYHRKRKRFYIHDRNNNKIPFARVIAESVLKRELKPAELVHHINGNSVDDRKGNLLVCDQSYHNWLHAKGKGRILYDRINC